MVIKRLRSLAREAGARIREHLSARDVLHAGQAAIEQITGNDVAYLRLVESEQLGPVLEDAPNWLIPAGVIRAHVPAGALEDRRSDDAR